VLRARPKHLRNLHRLRRDIAGWSNDCANWGLNCPVRRVPLRPMRRFGALAERFISPAWDRQTLGAMLRAGGWAPSSASSKGTRRRERRA
jgi:hypothetical protein